MSCKPLPIRNITLGEGRPKICVPILGRTEDEILASADAFLKVPADLAEWRADWFEDGKNPEAVCRMLEKLRQKLKEAPILFTFRSAREGGEQPIGAAEYIALNQAVCESGLADIVDIEFLSPDNAAQKLVEVAREHGVATVVSSHDFEKTPDSQEIFLRLRAMEELGASLPKMAVMPHSDLDVLALFEAALRMKAVSQTPFIVMSMAKTGTISRLTGEFTGSAITFGAASQASAPGQIEAGALRDILEALHSVLS